MAPLRCFCLSTILLFAAGTAFAPYMHDVAAAVEATPLITAALFRQSPFPNESRLDRMARYVKISKMRRQAIVSRMLLAADANASTGKDLVAPVYALPGISEYGMVLSIGTPAVTFQAVADTGSDLIWFPCEPYAGSTGAGPVFRPTSSTTYEPISCQDQKCTNLQSMKYCGNSSLCGFYEFYGGGATIFGNFATETVTMFGLDRKPQAINNVSFGCLHNGSKEIAQFQGLIGLGQGSISLVSQLGSTIQNMFSYCLLGFDAPPNATSELVFGASAALQGPGIQVTSITPNPVARTYYFVDLLAIGVAGTRIPIPQNLSPGGTILDSGTAITYVQAAVYSNIVAAFTSLINLPAINYSTAGFPYCVDASSQPEYTFPSLTLYFGNASIALPQENYFVKVDDKKPNAYCLCVVGTHEQIFPLQIIGNFMQQNHQLFYDLGHSRISWKPAQCDSV